MERQLLLAVESLEYELACLDFVERHGERPVKFEVSKSFSVV